MPGQVGGDSVELSVAEGVGAVGEGGGVRGAGDLGGEQFRQGGVRQRVRGAGGESGQFGPAALAEQVQGGQGDVGVVGGVAQGALELVREPFDGDRLEQVGGVLDGDGETVQGAARGVVFGDGEGQVELRRASRSQGRSRPS